MDLRISGRTALVCGSSRGMGFACAQALAEAGVNVVINGRDAASLAEAHDTLRAIATGTVGMAPGDVGTAEGRAAVLSVCPEPDILVNNSQGPPPGQFDAWGEGEWHEALGRSMVAPILLIRATIDGMMERGWGRIVNITSSAVKAPLPLLGLSNGARSGLTGFIAGLSREVAGRGVTINNILPGRIETERLRSYVAKVAEDSGVDVETARDRIMSANPMKRFGRSEEIGNLCAYLASEHAAYITGQNLLFDGGEYPGTL